MFSSVLQAQFEIDPPSLETPALEFMRSYWNDLRADRAMPSRADVRPADLRQHLDSLIMIDVIDGGEEFRYRLVGTAVTQYFFVDPTGKTMAEIWPQKAKAIADRARENLRRVVHIRQPVHVWGTLDWPEFGPEKFDALYLPFSECDDAVTMLLNIFTFERRQVLMSRQVARQNGRTKLLPD